MNIFDIWLPIAGMQFNVLLLLLIGFTVGVCGGFFGVGGAWIVTPALIVPLFSGKTGRKVRATKSTILSN